MEGAEGSRNLDTSLQQTTDKLLTVFLRPLLRHLSSIYGGHDKLDRSALLLNREDKGSSAFLPSQQNSRVDFPSF